MRLPTEDDLGQLAGLAPETRQHLLAHARVQDFEPTRVIYYQDDPTTHLHVLLRGHLRLSYIGEDGFVTLLSIVPPGHTFGETGLLDGAAHSDTASTIGTAEVLSIAAPALAAGGAAETELRDFLARLVARRLREYQQSTRALYFPNLGQRLSYTLLDLLDRMGNTLNYRGALVRCLGPEVTQRDLGAMARGTRENVNKTLRRWEQDGILSLEDRHIIELDRGRLEDIALNLD